MREDLADPVRGPQGPFRVPGTLLVELLWWKVVSDGRVQSSAKGQFLGQPAGVIQVEAVEASRAVGSHWWCWQGSSLLQFLERSSCCLWRMGWRKKEWIWRDPVGAVVLASAGRLVVVTSFLTLQFQAVMCSLPGTCERLCEELALPEGQ